jgi:GcrA cell cycle regulator
MPEAHTPWSEDRVEILLARWREGLSASIVATRLGGTTRNAVLGKLKRLGELGGRRVKKDSTSPENALRAHQRFRATRILRPKPAPSQALLFGHAGNRKPRSSGMPIGSEPEPLGIELLALRDGQCRWPHGDPKRDFGGFCGHPAAGRSYCLHHDRLAYR